jgi:hypothetical protein
LISMLNAGHANADGYRLIPLVVRGVASGPAIIPPVLCGLGRNSLWVRAKMTMARPASAPDGLRLRNLRMKPALFAAVSTLDLCPDRRLCGRARRKDSALRARNYAHNVLKCRRAAQSCA